MLDSFHFILTLLWLLYVVIHSLMAAPRFKTFAQKISGSYFKYYRLFYSVVAAISLALLLVYQFGHQSHQLYKPSTLHYVIAIPLIAAGVTVMIVCVRKYFINLSGVDVLLKKKTSPVLEKTGLHAYVRHPLYSGTLLFIWAMLIIFPLLSNLIACIIITIYTWIGIRIEEEKLVVEFGEDYRSYAASVPMLIPGLKGNHATP